MRREDSPRSGLNYILMFSSLSMYIFLLTKMSERGYGLLMIKRVLKKLVAPMTAGGFSPNCS
jgi:hypothetical protein